MHFYGLGILSILVTVVIAVVIAGFFMWLGAKVAGVRNATFGRAVMAAIGASFIMWIVWVIFSLIPVIGPIVGFFLGLLFAILVIQAAFQTSFGKAILVWIFNIIAQMVAMFIASGVYTVPIGRFFPFWR
jgi:hypothetical protein